MNRRKPLKTKPFVLRYFLSILFLTHFLFVSYAQETDTIVPVQKRTEKILRKIDLREITRNGLTPYKTKFSGHYAGIDFGFNMLVNTDYSAYDSEFLENDIFRSNSAYFNIVQQSIGLQKHRNTLGLVTGLGLHLQSYRLDDNTSIYIDENDVVQPQYLYYDQNQKSKLALVSLTIPLLMEWQIPVNHYDNRVYISAGLMGSLRLGSHTKIKYKTDQKEKLKVDDHFSIQPFTYSLMIRTGYRWFNVFASYDLMPLFKKEKGPELTPFTVGITLLRF
ncbi:outer membrane beta-barrel protein [uncultured Draconibacterium sp.]|uniref:outer membrane beta-barrel protein n=1 Tax=uncultured Draconibacterium sp. TaxID=1573823 RepID=UPI0032163C8E